MCKWNNLIWKNPSKNPFCFSLPNLTAFANEINFFLSLFISIFYNISYSLSAILNVFQRLNENFIWTWHEATDWKDTEEFLQKYLSACNFWTLKSSINFINSYISPEDETTFKNEHKSIYDQMSLLSIVTKIVAMLAVVVMNPTSNKYLKWGKYVSIIQSWSYYSSGLWVKCLLSRTRQISVLFYATKT